MRLFQNSGIYPSYLARLNRLAVDARTFDERLGIFLDDRFGAVHFLKPVLDRSPDAFLTNHDDRVLQGMWARERGMRHDAKRDDILLAQIEHHRTEVFYDIDPTGHEPDFLRRLPGSVRVRIAWRAAPLGGASLAGYDAVVCNFRGIIEAYRRKGWPSEYFWPAHDPVMDEYAARGGRGVDVVFVGGYTRHHRRRAELLEALAPLASDFDVALHLDCSRLTRWCESPLGRLLPVSRYRRPAEIRRVAKSPIFGRDLYAALAGAKIVVNGAIDMAGDDRGNMRCFEAMGLGALLLSDVGNYPEGMVDGATMTTYRSAPEAVAIVRRVLTEPGELSRIARAGNELVRTRYSKGRQWEAFQALVAARAG